MPEDLATLREEVSLLRVELAVLRAEVQRLGSLVERQRTGEGSPSVANPPTGYHTAAESLSAGTPGSGLSDAGRKAICEGIALHLKRALSGQHRGESGRDQLPSGSRFWLVIRSYTGEVFDPVRVYSRWGPAKAVTKRGEHLGDSVFVGLPSLGDVGRVTEAGGFAWDGATLQ